MTRQHDSKPTNIEGLVHFQINISWSFTHPHVLQDVHVFISSVEKKLRFLMKIVSFNGLQTVEGQTYSFSAASKGYKWYQTMNKGLAKWSVI